LCILQHGRHADVGGKEAISDPSASRNRSAYDAIAGAWDRARATFVGRERDYLDALLDGLPVPSRVLDLGCGTGRPMAEYVLGRGHRVTGVDQSEELLELAARRFPGAAWVRASLEEFAFEGPYAGIVCWDALFHVPRAEHEAILGRAAGALRVGGRLMLTVGGSASPPFQDTMFGETFFYDSYPPDVVLAMVRQLGLTPVISEFINLPTAGRDKGRYAIVAEKG
jgi:SAM-dependent methyltransferase